MVGEAWKLMTWRLVFSTISFWDLVAKGCVLRPWLGAGVDIMRAVQMFHVQYHHALSTQMCWCRGSWRLGPSLSTIGCVCHLSGLADGFCGGNAGCCLQGV